MIGWMEELQKTSWLYNGKTKTTMNKNSLFFTLAAIVLAACTQMEKTAGSDVPINLSFSTAPYVQTKSLQDLEWSIPSGEHVWVRVSFAGENIWTQYTFTAGENGALIPPTDGPRYPEDKDQKIDIVAIYPTIGFPGEFDITAEQSRDDAYKWNDLMFASVTNQGSTSKTVNLAFTHKMAKLCLNVTAGQGVNTIEDPIRIQYPLCNIPFDWDTGALGEAYWERTMITLNNHGVAFFPPQTYTGQFLKITTDMGDAYYSISNKTFESGKQYTINLTVNARAVGTTTAITQWTSEGTTATVNPQTDIIDANVPEGVDAVDLGITVGGKKILWANMNVGAVSETDYGTLFAWGETTGYTDGGDNVKTYFTNDTYAWTRKDSQYNYYYFTKYCDSAKISQLEPGDDAAHANWGGEWRMPTKDEWDAFIATKHTSGYTWTWCDGSTTKYKGSTVAGLQVTCAATNGTVFLPAAGRFDESTNSNGYYWSSSLHETEQEDEGGTSTLVVDPACAWVFTLSDSDQYLGYLGRSQGISVRAVME